MKEEVTVQTSAMTEQKSSLSLRREQSKSYLFLKRFFDVTCAAIALVPLCIPMLVIAVCIRMTSPGKAFFLQNRVGKDGKPFTIYKFRSMVNGADDLKKHLSPELYAKYMRDRKLEHDPRVTDFGEMLRRTSLDELPQLINILLGHMSFVGPRPLLEDEVFTYGSAFDLYKQMKPGLTGLWQIESRHFTVLTERAKMDTTYYLNRSLRLDGYIFFKTFAVVFSKKGAC